MFRRFRSLYGRLVVLALAFLCFIFVLNVSVYHENSVERSDEDTNVIRMPMPFRRNPYEQVILLDLLKQQPGLGDGGKAVFLKGEAKRRGDESYKKIALNEEISKHLPYNRTTADSRNPLCRTFTYELSTLPTASVVIIFYNEPYSVLLRTVHSVLNTCNARILNEIILVDDGSTNVELGGKLDYYISSRLPAGRVHLLRLKNRLGLIRARLAGARIATGEVLIFLDAHCEANIGWTEPLLERIKKSRTSVLVPIIDVIDSKDFKYSVNDLKSFQVGGFQWNGNFNWIVLSEREKLRLKRECNGSDEICPTYSPTMAGGLFAIDRQYFWEIGSYDDKMDGWGGENLEMSFRIWQCGGTIETIPCSRVGHVFRDFHPYKFPNGRDTAGINLARMALTWMDEYANIFFVRRPDLKSHPEIGDITHRVALRKKLRCKNFEWYLKNVYPEKFIPNENVQGYGRVHAVGQKLCLDDLGRSYEQQYNQGVYQCSDTVPLSQFLSLTLSGVLRNEIFCATVVKNDSTTAYRMVMAHCVANDDFNEKWDFLRQQLIHKNTGMCLDSTGLNSMDDVKMAQCDANSETQRWTFERD